VKDTCSVDDPVFVRAFGAAVRAAVLRKEERVKAEARSKAELAPYVEAAHRGVMP
jgi:hypothetical protein